MGNLEEIWIFDVDGVITNPITKLITHPEILTYIEKKLSQQIPVCLNTGRSSIWVQKELISQLNPKTELTNLFVACEMGNVTLEFDTKNAPLESMLGKNIIPTALSNTIREIVKSSYLDSMFVDETKKSILTIEMNSNFPKAQYEILQSRLSGEIRIILKNYHPGIHVRPSSSSIAIDIKPIDSDKARGAQLILDWLKSKKFKYDEYCFTTFGDSISDMQMAIFFENEGLETKFVYVGTDIIQSKLNHPPIITTNHYTSGTLEYLQS